MSPAPAAARPRRSGGELRPTDLLIAFFACAIIYLLLGAVAGVIAIESGVPKDRWVALHLVFIGGISQLVLGAAPFFAGAFLATSPPPRGLVRAQLAVWNTGAALVVAGVLLNVRELSIGGAVLLGAGLVLFTHGLRFLARRSIQSQPWALRWYLAGAWMFMAGVLAGGILVSGTMFAADHRDELLGAHITLNIGGWFGTAIVGTLHTFFPSLTQTQLRWPLLQPPTFRLWVAGTLLLAAGFGLAVGGLVVAGWALLLVAALLLAANMAASLRSMTTPGLLPARLLVAAQAALLGSLAVLLIDSFSGPLDLPAPVAVVPLLLGGWLGLTVAGAMLHLLAVVGRVRDLRRPPAPPRPLRDAAVVSLALTGVFTLAGANVADDEHLMLAGTLITGAAYAILAAMILGSAARALRGGPPRI